MAMYKMYWCTNQDGQIRTLLVHAECKDAPESFLVYPDEWDVELRREVEIDPDPQVEGLFEV